MSLETQVGRTFLDVVTLMKQRVATDIQEAVAVGTVALSEEDVKNLTAVLSSGLDQVAANCAGALTRVVTAGS